MVVVNYFYKNQRFLQKEYFIKKIFDFFNNESKKKKFTSLTAVCNDNTKPISIICNMNNIKVITTRKGIQKTIKTLPHDSKSIIPAINDINKKYGVPQETLFPEPQRFAVILNIVLFENVYALDPKGLGL